MHFLANANYSYFFMLDFWRLFYRISSIPYHYCYGFYSWSWGCCTPPLSLISNYWSAYSSRAYSYSSYRKKDISRWCWCWGPQRRWYIKKKRWLYCYSRWEEWYPFFSWDCPTRAKDMTYRYCCCYRTCKALWRDSRHYRKKRWSNPRFII